MINLNFKNLKKLSQSDSSPSKPTDDMQITPNYEYSSSDDELIQAKKRKKNYKSSSDDEFIAIKQTKKRKSSTKRKSITKVVIKSRKSSFEKKSPTIEDIEEETTTQLLEDDGDIKWESLHHQGVYFAPEYVPHNIPLLYEGKEVKLESEAEEVATFFAGVLNTDYEKNPVFCANFFEDFKQVLNRTSHKHIKDFKKCDFTLIYNYIEELKVQRKNMTKEEKLIVKQEKLKLEEQFGTAIIDGRKEKIGNFRLEPPGLFRGRGKHPKTGKLKKRLMPGDIVLNLSRDAPIPSNPYNQPWKEVVHNPTVTWLAMWKENINNNIKYVFLSHGSTWKSQSDLKKFEKARELSKYISIIRRDYNKDLNSKDDFVFQRATALYFIDILALRAGNEKGDDEADTVGCCSLRVEHVTLKKPDILVFDFLGKDSIRYHNELQVEPVVFKNIEHLTKNKSKDHDLFDKLTTTSLNKHLQKLMDGLTAKVFRTYNASHTFQKELEKTPIDATLQEKILAFNRSNREVAILCNHQKSVSKGHDGQMKKIRDKLLGFCYQQMLIQEKLDQHTLDIKEELVQEVTEEWIKEHLEMETELNEKKLIKSYERYSEKQKEKQEEVMTFEEFKVSKTVAKEKNEEKLLKEYEKLNERIEQMQTTMTDKDEGKTTSLGTSKQNYIDPRITVAWCKKFQVPVEKMLNKSLREKFKWALSVDESWLF